MAVSAVHVLEANAHDSRLPRQLTAGLTAAPLTGSFAGGLTASEGHGVAGSADYAVTQNGSPNMSVNVAAGFAFVRGQFSVFNQGVYGVPNDGTVNLAIAAADGSNPRRDLIILQVRDDSWGGGGGVNDARLVVVTGTPAASPADPSLSGHTNNLVLARVQVPAGASSVLTANITDLRAAAGGYAIANALNALPKGRVASAQATADQGSIAGSEVNLSNGTVVFTAVAGRRYKVTSQWEFRSTVAADVVWLILRDGIGGTQLKNAKLRLGAVGIGESLSLTWVSTSSIAGSKTYQMSAVRVAGSGTITSGAAAAEPAITVVEDIELL